MNYTTDDLRKKWLAFYESKQHAIIPSAGVLPENDPSALFHNSGMHPLVPYLMGEKHPKGVRLANSQKCIRTGDIDEVGDATHLTFFEMLGNWSLGDYFKEDQIAWSFEFLTETLGLPLEKLACSVFEGDDNAPRDDEAAAIWAKVGMPKNRIAYLDANENWWAKGDTGPCGPDSEMFYWVGDAPAPENYQDTWEDPNWVEIWNDVFMQFNKTADGSLEKLPAQNVDTGMGLERTVAVLNGQRSVYQTDAFANILGKIANLADNQDLSTDPLGTTDQHNSARVIADHIRSGTVILGDGVIPSNLDQGYILRRLLRRAIRHGRKLGITDNFTAEIAKVVIAKLGDQYPELKNNKDTILKELDIEETQFRLTLEKGEKEFEKMSEKVSDQISGKQAFNLFQTYGFPLEMTIELADEKGLKVDEVGFKSAFQEHQSISKKGSEQKFAGGLADNSEKTTAYHTATHLMLAGLRSVLGDHVHQKGSNITGERARFDFNHEAKLTDEEKAAVEQFVNDAIAADAKQVLEEMDKEEARAAGVEGSFWEKYPDRVKVYTFKDDTGKVWTSELCGGPHAESTSTLGTFKIKKEQSCGRGIRRIKAVLS